MPPSHTQKILKTEPLDNNSAKWATLKKITYTDPLGNTRTWESSERLTRPASSGLDGVGIVALLRDPSCPDESPRIVLQKQYRPPIDAVCIEVPAGLMDEGETPEQCAVRELREETGYVGGLVEGGFGVTPVMFNDPGFCNTNLRMIHVTVDMSDPANRNPRPELEEGEFIETFTVRLTDLWDECVKFEREGYAIDARVGTLAEGVEFAKRWRL